MHTIKWVNLENIMVIQTPDTRGPILYASVYVKYLQWENSQISGELGYNYLMAMGFSFSVIKKFWKQAIVRVAPDHECTKYH